MDWVFPARDRGIYTAGCPPLDILTSFFSLIVVSFFSLRRLKRLDASSSIEIVHVLFDPWDPEGR